MQSLNAAGRDGPRHGKVMNKVQGPLREPSQEAGPETGLVTTWLQAHLGTRAKVSSADLLRCTYEGSIQELELDIRLCLQQCSGGA